MTRIPWYMRTYNRLKLTFRIWSYRRQRGWFFCVRGSQSCRFYHSRIYDTYEQAEEAQYRAVLNGWCLCSHIVSADYHRPYGGTFSDKFQRYC